MYCSQRPNSTAPSSSPSTPWTGKKSLRTTIEVAPLIASAFDEIPLTTLFLPDGFDGDEVRVGRLHKPAPFAIPTVQVQTLEGPFPFVALTAKSMLWEIHRGAFGFEP